MIKTTKMSRNHNSLKGVLKITHIEVLNVLPEEEIQAICELFHDPGSRFTLL